MVAQKPIFPNHKNHVPFGQAQQPELWDYADGGEYTRICSKRGWRIEFCNPQPLTSSIVKFNTHFEKAMFFPEQLTDMGINAPKEHQRIISKLTTGLGSLYYQEQKITLEPLPATMIDEGQTRPVPDVLLYDNEHQQTSIIIEVCHTTGVRNDTKKIIRLIEEFEYGIEEGFLYDYAAKQWLRYAKDGDVEEGNSFSKVLQLDLNGFL